MSERRVLDRQLDRLERCLEAEIRARKKQPRERQRRDVKAEMRELRERLCIPLQETPRV